MKVEVKKVDALKREMKFEIPREKLDHGLLVAQLAHLAGLTASVSEARRHMEGGGLRVNDEVWKEPKAVIGSQYLNSDGVIKLSIGRKKHLLVKPK